MRGNYETRGVYIYIYYLPEENWKSKCESEFDRLYYSSHTDRHNLIGFLKLLDSVLQILLTD